MSLVLPAPASAPTMYFIGVSTTSSAIHRVFDAWRGLLGLDGVELVGVDLPVGSSADDYRRLLRMLRDDPMAYGALVTTHKIDVFESCRDLFESVNDDALRLGEVSALVTREGCLDGLALDTITSELSLHGIVQDLTGRDVLVLGAGGASLALCDYLAHRPAGRSPRLVTVTDIAESRLTGIKKDVATGDGDIEWHLEVVDVDVPQDAFVASLRPGGVVVNATGMGKDRPGSPLSDAAVFPRGGVAWEFNYRGELGFLQQARARAEADDLVVEDGWRYFVHGWTRAISVVLDIDIPTEGPVFDDLYDRALAVR